LPKYPTAQALIRLIAALALTVEAIPAEHGAVAARLEGNLCGNAAIVAYDFIHLALATVDAIIPARSTAAGATAWLVLETFFGVECLLRSRKNKFRAAFATS